MGGGRGKRIAFGVVLVAGALGFAEVFAALAYHFLLSSHTRMSVENTLRLRTPGEMNSTLRFRAHPFLNYTGNQDYRDRDGERSFMEPGVRAGTSPAGPADLRIVALGGSTTFGQFVPNIEDVWPARAGRLVGQRSGVDVAVINAALPGFSSYHLLAVATLWLPELDADLVLIHCGFNDAFYAAFADEGGADGRGYDRPWYTSPLPPALRSAMRASHLVRIVLTPWLIKGGRIAGDIFAVAHHPPPTDADEITGNAARATGRYYRRNLETLIALIRHAGAEPVLVNMPLNPARLDGFGPFYDVGFAATRRNNRIMTEVGAAAGVVVIDLEAQIHAPELFIDPVHVNDLGHARKAAIVADELEPLVARRLRSRASSAD